MQTFIHHLRAKRQQGVRGNEAKRRRLRTGKRRTAYNVYCASLREYYCVKITLLFSTTVNLS
jgi:hypothetical protein